MSLLTKCLCVSASQGMLVVPLMPEHSKPVVVLPPTSSVEFVLGDAEGFRVDADGHYAAEHLVAGDRITIESCEYPLPLIAADDPTDGWIKDLVNILNWNRPHVSADA